MGGARRRSALPCHLPLLLLSPMSSVLASHRVMPHSRRLAHVYLLLGCPRIRSSPLTPLSGYATHADRAYPTGLPCTAGVLIRFLTALLILKVKGRYAT